MDTLYDYYIEKNWIASKKGKILPETLEYNKPDYSRKDRVKFFTEIFIN